MSSRRSSERAQQPATAWSPYFAAVAFAFFGGGLIGIQASAGVQCDKSLTRVEKIICETPNDHGSLVETDRVLNAAYAATLAVVADKAALRKGELAWLQSRDSCDDYSCVVSSMRNRISELARQRIEAQPPLNAPPLDAGAAAGVCEALGRQISQRTIDAFAVPPEPGLVKQSDTGLLAQAYLLTLRQGKPPVRFGSFGSGGSCSPRTVAPMWPDGAPHESDVVDIVGQELSDTLYAAGDTLVYYKRRYYILTYGQNFARTPVLIQVVTTEGGVRPLCALKPQGLDKSVIPTTASELCRAYAAGSLKSADWKPLDLPAESLKKIAPLAADVEKVEVANVDFGGNGTTERIARFDQGDGAGCGHSYVSFVPLSRTGNTVSTSAIAHRLNRLDFTEDSNIVISGNHAYVAAHFQEPTSAVSLVDIASDPPHEMCTFRTRYKVERLFSRSEND